MSNEPLSIIERILQSSGKAVRLADLRQDRLVDAAKNGDLYQLREMLQNPLPIKTVETDQSVIFEKLITCPYLFPKKTGVIEMILETKFDIEGTFIDLEKPEDLRPAMWTMYVRSPSEDSLQASVMLIAESIRNDMRFDEQPYQPWKLISEPKKLSDKFTAEQVRSALIAVQHALVDYIANADANDLSRAAGFLKFSDFLDGSDLWTKKITSLRETRAESVKLGEIIKYAPIYG